MKLILRDAIVTEHDEEHGRRLELDVQHFEVFVRNCGVDCEYVPLGGREVEHIHYNATGDNWKINEVPGFDFLQLHKDDELASLLHLAVTEDYLYCSCDPEMDDEVKCGGEGECNGDCECVYGESVTALRKRGYDMD